MASIKNVALKNIKTTTGREGYGATASVYVNGKKIGTYADYADGAMGDIQFTSKEGMEAFYHIVFQYGKENPNDYIMNLYKKKPERYEEEIKRIKQYMPFIKDEEITMESVSAHHLDYIICKILELADLEKEFKKAVKKGYSYIAVKEGQHGQSEVYYIPDKADKKELDEFGCTKFYKSLDDFNIA